MCRNPLFFGENLHENIRHVSDDQLNITLEKLALMGYKIDDPMIVRLVEDCKGDISKILDCLHG